MSYTVKQEKFEGPLDLLLELIQGEKLSINEISLAKVTDEFIAYLKTLQERGEARLPASPELLQRGEPDGQADQPAQISQSETWAGQEILAEFLVVAATLLLIKSRSLLPGFAFAPAEEASIHELEDRLALYQRMRKAAGELAALARGGQKSFSREAFAGMPSIFRPPKRLPAEGLSKTLAALLAAIPKAEKLAEEKLRKVISLEEKIRELQTLLREKVERAFSELVAGAKEKVEIIVSFLALLELTRQKLVAVEQRGLFGDIKIRKV